MNKKLSELITQILKQDNLENIKEKNMNSIPETTKNKKNKETKVKNIVDMLKKIIDDFSDVKKNKSVPEQSLGYDSLIPDSYKLTLSYDNKNFEGHYNNITNKYDKYKTTKTLSYSAMATEIDHKNKQDALTIIKDKKENKKDSFLFDSDTKSSVESYKWQSIAWWHFMYELEGKIIF